MIGILVDAGRILGMVALAIAATEMLLGISAGRKP